MWNYKYEKHRIKKKQFGYKTNLIVAFLLVFQSINFISLKPQSSVERTFIVEVSNVTVSPFREGIKSKWSHKKI